MQYLSILYLREQVLSITIATFKADGSSIKISWFYCPPKENNASCWNNIMNMEGAIDLPWICSGDFNEFNWLHENEGGNPWNLGERCFLRDFMHANK